MKRLTRPMSALTAAVLCAGLVSCGGSDDGAVSGAGSTTVEEAVAADEATTVPDVSESTPTLDPTTTTTNTADAITTTTEASAPASSAPAPGDDDAADGAGCLVGDWVITEAEMNAYYDAIEARLGDPAPTFEIGGQTLLSFTPTEYVYTADFDLTMEVVGQTGRGVSTGTASGTWTGTDGYLATELTSSDLAVAISVGGVDFDGSDLANGFLDSVPLNGAPYDCSGPTIGFATGGDDAPRHPVLLTPA